MVPFVMHNTALEPGATPDRRVRKTRRQLHGALVELISELPYADVTIDMITERADVARATFYAHFDDKGALLESVADELIAELSAELVPRVSAGTKRLRGEGVITLYSRAAANRDVYLALLGGAGDGRALHRVYEIFTAGVADVFVSRFQNSVAACRVPLPVIVRGWVGAHLSMLTWWLESGSEFTPEQMALMELQLDVYGLPWALGLEPDEIEIDEIAVLAADRALGD
jgi:AcrR family transcriptional regulator